VRPAARTPWDPRLAHEAPVAVIAPGTETTVHVRNLAVSSALSRHYVMNLIPPEAVIDVLNAAGVRFLLAGAHAIGGWTNRPRTTEDVDVLVAARHVRAAVRAIQAAYPYLQVRDTPVVARFVDPESGNVVIDVMKPNQPLHRVALRHAHPIETAARTYSVPSLEFALAMKFAAMVSPRRERLKKMQDAVDFAAIVGANPVVRLRKLTALGERAYPGGGAEIVELVRKAQSGEPFQI
jgi:hypothetical protein